ncbi:hypothetical protein LguiA_003032 [Lonicera macranthoides]
MFMASGTIIECSKDHDGRYLNTILTSASLLGSATDDIEVEVYLYGGRTFDGSIYAYDLHYNLALINILSDAPLPVTTLAPFEVPRRIKPQGWHVIEYGVCIIESVVAVGRHGRGSSSLLMNDGDFMYISVSCQHVDCCRFDCKELLRSSCRIDKMCSLSVYIQPLTNSTSVRVPRIDVISPANHPVTTIFLRFCRPWSGIELEYLDNTDIILEPDMESLLPDIYRAIIVTEVAPGSPADRAGVLRDDVILNFCGHSLQGTVEFYEKIWDKVGESVELIVIRKGTGTLNLTMEVDEVTNPLNFNR